MWIDKYCQKDNACVFTLDSEIIITKLNKHIHKKKTQEGAKGLSDDSKIK